MCARRSLFLLVLLCCALVLQGCGGGGGNKAPRITAYSPQKNYAVVKDGQVQFSVTASDPENDSLVYNWQSTAGSFVGAANSNTVTWKAPSEPGTCTVTVTVRDAKGNTTSHTFYFTVKGSVEFVDEDITQSKTWAAGNIYVINSRDINVTGTLKIEAGAIVKFGEGYSLRTSGSGRIEAVGTEAKPVIFTSFHDDLHGGDTNQNQNATGPFAGDWVGISLAGSRNGNKFVYCEFYYGGAGYAGSMLDLDGTTGTQVENCTFAFSAGIGLDATSAQNPVIKGNVFYHNEKPLVINVDTNLDDSNTFHNPQAPNEKNTYQGIFVNPAAGSTFSKTTSWAESEAAFVLDGNQWYIEPGGKLTLGPGVTVKFTDRSYLAVRANLEAKGQAGKPVVFTSVNDSTYGGDSNGPASDDPYPGDWQSIFIESASRATFEHCVIAYGGTQASMADGSAAVMDTESSSGTTVKNTVFQYNLRALDLLSRNSTIENCTFEHNTYPLRVNVNTDTDNSLEIADNSYNAIYLAVPSWSPTFAKSEVDWLHTGVPYVLLDNLSTETTTINLGSGTIIRVGLDFGIFIDQGGRLTGLANAIFTSCRDTTRGGNVGWPGPAAKGDWQGIYDSNQSKYLSGPNIFFARYPQ